VGVELFHAAGQTDGWTDGRTDIMKVKVSFRYFANAPKIAGKFIRPHVNENNLCGFLILLSYQRNETSVLTPCHCIV
jgi:hypothetical protein